MATLAAARAACELPVARLQCIADDMQAELRQGLAAAIYTQTSDCEGEINGLMTYDRRVVKFDAAKLAELHTHRANAAPAAALQSATAGP